MHCGCLHASSVTWCHTSSALGVADYTLPRVSEAPVSADVDAAVLGPDGTCRAVRLRVCTGWPHSSLTCCSRLPVARSAHGATVYSDKLWIFAGYDGNAR